MNKVEFLSALQQGLRSVPPEDRQEILYDYEEHFRIGMEEGKTDEEIAASLGDPRGIARAFTSQYNQHTVRPPYPTERNGMQALLSIACLFFEITLMIPLYLALEAVLLSAVLVSGTFAVTGVIFTFTVLFQGILPQGTLVPVALKELSGAFGFFGVGLFALGILLLMASVHIVRGSWRLPGCYLQFKRNLLGVRR